MAFSPSQCLELQGYVRPLLELLNGLKKGRFDKGETKANFFCVCLGLNIPLCKDIQQLYLACNKLYSLECSNPFMCGVIYFSLFSSF